VSVNGGTPASRLSEVDVAGKFTDDEDVQPGDQLRLETGGAHQLLVADGRAEVCEQSQVLAQAENRLFRAQWPVQRVVLPVSHGAKQDGIGLPGQLQCAVGQRMAVGLIGSATNQRRLGLEGQAQGFKHLDGLCNNFLADAVTRQYRDFHGGK
jgi:hypothetical protein